MSNLSNILEIGRRALSIQQTALDLTSKNIANVNTDGYSRQRAEIVSDSSLYSRMGAATNIRVSSIERLHDKYIEGQLRSQTSTMGWFDANKASFGRLEEIMNEPSNMGIASAMTDFFDAWHALGNDSESAIARENVLLTGNTLSKNFNDTYQRISDFKREVGFEFKDSVGSFNDLLDNLADINRIMPIAHQKENAADFMDKRDRILQEMSEYADIKVAENDDGSVLISQGGNVILQGVDVNHLVAGDNTENPGTYRWENRTTPMSFDNGKFGALQELYGSRLEQVLDELDTLATTVANSVNEQHRMGTSIDASVTSGYNFFDIDTTGAQDIKLSTDVKNDILRIAASKDGNSGDGANALAIAQLVDKRMMLGETSTLHDYYANTIGKIGAESAHFQSVSEGQSMFIEQLENRQLATSGVSLDEEMTDLMTFQRAYQAAAQIINTADDLMETVINLI